MEPGSPAEQASSTAYWQVPADVPIVLVDDTDKLQQWRGMIESAVAVGIDAEWKPNSKEPKATVLQLACLASNGQERVFVLDMLALDMEDVGALLQSLFRSKHCLKVGFGLLQDVKAVAAALGAIGGGCTAVLDPQLDLAVVHRLLVRRRWRGVHASSGPGLSGFVAAQLGLSLDKRQQCSPWDLRPLTDAQIAYAATDASCLLALLRSLALAAAPSDTRFFGDERIRSRGGRLGEGQDASAGAAPAAVPGEEGPGPSGGTGWLQDASQHWGCRMEFVGKSVWRERLAPCWRQLEALGSRSGDLSAIGFPEDVPWLLGVERPRFVADTMAEGLARQLRLCGVDCVSTQPVGKNQRHLVYRQLKDLSEGEGRVILTSDRAFVRSRYSDHTYFVQSQTKQQQLTEVLQDWIFASNCTACAPVWPEDCVLAFDIKIEGDDLLSRCVQCNGEITQTPLTWNQLPQTAQSTVPLSIRCNHSLYWLCNRCSKVYWQGSQYGKAVQSMSERLAAVTMC